MVGKKIIVRDKETGGEKINIKGTITEVDDYVWWDAEEVSGELIEDPDVEIIDWFITPDNSKPPQVAIYREGDEEQRYVDLEWEVEEV